MKANNFKNIDQSDLDVLFEEPNTLSGYINHLRLVTEIQMKNYNTELYNLCKKVRESIILKINEIQHK